MGQGGPTGGGQPLNQATGKIVVDVSQLAQAASQVNAFSAGVGRAFLGINTQATTAAQGISNVTNVIRGLAGAFGVSLGIQGVVQLGKVAIGASEVAVAYRRQQVAALSLAGSQAQLNALMADYDKVTGGAIPKTQELENVTKLLGLGFANSVKQLDDFERAARGISLGQKLPLDDVNEKLETAIISRRRNSLRDLGLQYDAVIARARQFEQANRSLTDQQAYAMAVVDEAIKKYGQLADIPTTGLETAKKKWADLGLKIGEVASGPVNLAGIAATSWLDRQIALTEGWQQELEKVENTLRNLPGLLRDAAAGGIAMPQGWNGSGAWAGGSALGGGGGGGGKGGFGGPPEPSDEEIAIDMAWNERKKKINADAQDAIEAEDKQAGAGRADIVANNNKEITREAEDFARQRVGEERKLGLDILDVAQTSARQRVRWEAELERTIATAQTDSAERVAGIRKDSAKRLQDIEENFQEEQIKAARHFKEELSDAAGDLDAKRVSDLQKQYEDQQKDAKESHDKQVSDAKDQLQERLDDESKSLAKSITQQRTALAQREADQKADDAQRVTDLKAAFEAQKTEEDTERGIRVDRQKADFTAQLTAFDNAHADRIDQIHKHAAAEKTANDEEWKKQLDAIGVEVDGYADELKRITDEAIKQARRYLHEGFGIGAGDATPTIPGNSPHGVPAFANGGFVPRDMLAYVHRGEYVTPTARVASGNFGPGNRSVQIGALNVNVAGTNASADDIANAVDARLRRHLEDWAA